jgi:hypothetical protein
VTDEEKKRAEFAGSTYFGVNEPERLTHETAREAIQGYFEESFNFDFEGTPKLWAEQHAPLEVIGYEPMKVDDKRGKRMADWAVDHAIQDLFEDGFLDPDEDSQDVLKGDHWTLAHKEIAAAFDKAIKQQRIWGCEAVARREFPEEELLQILKDGFPEEFEEEKP